MHGIVGRASITIIANICMQASQCVVTLLNAACPNYVATPLKTYNCIVSRVAMTASVSLCLGPSTVL